MGTKDKLGFIALGFIVWAAATLFFRITGSFFFEGSVVGYWLNLISTSILYAGISLGLMKWRKIEQKDWPQGAICVALPGMLGEIPILVGFSELMSNMQPTTAGRYAAFLFGGYSTLIGAAWFMSARASSQVTSAIRFVGDVPARNIPAAKVQWFDSSGHLPYLEEYADEFNQVAPEFLSTESKHQPSNTSSTRVHQGCQ